MSGLCNENPKAWAEANITAFHKYEANMIVGEVNNGGDLVERNIKAVDTKIPFKGAHAPRGKAIRSEPICSALYEQRKVHHFGTSPQLEDQMCEWVLGVKNSPIEYMLLFGRSRNLLKGL